MNRAVLFLSLVLAGCNRDEAVRAAIQLDPSLSASCVVLEVHTPEGKVLETNPLSRPEGREVRVAVFRKDLPADVELQARALWGASGCDEPLFYNGRSESVAVHFEPGTQNASLTLSPPGDTEDEDRDGFVAAELGGADCDDKQPERQPKAQETCDDASNDLNCNDRRGCDDATCAGKTCSRAPALLFFSLSTLETTAGECSQTITVERRESDGTTPSRAGFPTPFTLASTYASGVTFHSDPVCSKPAPSSIPAGSSSVTFYVRSTTIGEGSVRASASALQPATLRHTLRAGPATKLAFTSPSTTTQAGDCSLVSLEWRDAFGNLTPDRLASLSLNYTPTNPEDGFYQDVACTQPLNPGALAPAPSLTFYFKGTHAPSAVITATSSVSTQQAQETRTVTALAASRLSLSPPGGQVLLAGQCSAPVNVSITDKYGNLSTFPSGQLLSLAPLEAGAEVFQGTGCVSSQKLGNELDPRGNNPVTLSLKGKTGSTVELKVSGASVGEVRQSQTIIPAVRRGSCLMGIGEKTKSCPIGNTDNSLVPVTLSRSFLVFQATTDNDTPATSFVRCSLAASSVDCARSDSTGHANIDWQVVELQGLTVQHLSNVTCNQNNISLNTSVNMASTFVLFSTSQDGGAVDQNDFPSVRLVSGNQVAAPMNGGCNPNQFYSFQVVQFANSQVQRGITGSMNDELLTVPSLPTTDLSRSIVLSTWQVSTSGQDIYKRMVRGEIDPADSTRLNFHRGAGTKFTSNDIPQISWERITFPTGTLVQTHVLKVNEGVPGTSVTLATAVDRTRTLLLTSSQASGQGAGETSYSTNDVLGTATGRLSLNEDQLSVMRDNPLGAASWTVYAIQFDP